MLARTDSMALRRVLIRTDEWLANLGERLRTRNHGVRSCLDSGAYQTVNVEKLRELHDTAPAA
jgi:hypothetical protein